MRVDIASSAASPLHDTTSGVARETGGGDADLSSTPQQGESQRGLCMYVRGDTCTCVWYGLVKGCTYTMYIVHVYGMKDLWCSSTVWLLLTQI